MKKLSKLKIAVLCIVPICMVLVSLLIIFPSEIPSSSSNSGHSNPFIVFLVFSPLWIYFLYMGFICKKLAKDMRYKYGMVFNYAFGAFIFFLTIILAICINSPSSSSTNQSSALIPGLIILALNIFNLYLTFIYNNMVDALSPDEVLNIL